MRNPSTDTPALKQKLAGKGRRLDTAQLGDLYPKPKTYQERLHDQSDREARRLQRQPRYLALSTATRLFVVVAIGSFLFTLAPLLVTWFFNFVLCVLILLGIIKWQTSEISSALYDKGLNDTTFFILYVILLAPLTATALYQSSTQANLFVILAMYLLLFLMHFLCVHFLIRFMSRQQ